MKLVDLSHPWNMHTPGWVGYPGSKIYYTQTLQTNRIVSQRVETSLHVGTHLDGPMHAADGAGDIASLPLTKLVHEGVIVDVSDVADDWSIITPKHITDRMEVKRGDILILHTGWHRYYEGRTQQDLVRYFCYHPGPSLDTMHWMLARKIKWFAMDTGSCDHPMNTSIRHMRPDIADEFARTHGKAPAEFFGTFEYVHKLSGRRVTADIFPFHNWAFQEGLLHAENIGGDIELVLGRRCLIGAFPWRYQGLESCPCRIVAMLDADGVSVEALGAAAQGLAAG